MPLFFGRLDYDAGPGRRAGRDPLHRPPARDRRGRRRTDGDRLAGRHVAAVLPGPAGRADGRTPPPPVRLRPRPADRVRGRGPDPARSRWPPPTSSSRRSSDRGPVRCATSSPPSSRSRTPSSAPDWPSRSCVQGAPGTGKTAVGLHRAAYLLYAFRDQLARSGVLVVGPERQLPVLHRRRAAGPRRDRRHPGHGRVAGQPRPPRSPIRGEDPVPAALIKGDARMAEVLRRAVWSHLRPADGAARGAARRAPVAGRRRTSPTR